MECQTCHNYHRKFYCANCLRERLKTYNAEYKKIFQVKQQKIERANKFLSGSVRNLQISLADKHNRLQKLNNLEIEVKKRKEEINRQEIESRKKILRSRRQLLLDTHTYFKKFKSHQKSIITKDIDNIKENWRNVHQILIQSRKVLISINIENNVISLSSNGNGKNEDFEFSIAGRTLPRKADFTNYQLEEINTAVGHVIHMLGLIAHYLGVNLPFTLVNKGSNSCAEGTLNEITERSKRTPLFLTVENLEGFTVGMAMLNYNIAYLCHTQGIEIPYHKVPHTLHNLFLCCHASNLGRYGHLTEIYRQPDQSFNLDFQEVVRMMLAPRNGSDIKYDLLIYNIIGTTLNDYFEGDIEDDNENEDGENWVLCDTV
ncbi:15257_t:CDS:2 [Funneliformis caledonium]|uniref:Autophagy-related protein 14 n=1 Tax=Funneliformis caledonium TaxID=1117310 RepID=A0A9N8YYP6_9GLOM|nr:15257_t:CDS:2 [Funneliformis caledonium]